jgi:hypothetical protein
MEKEKSYDIIISKRAEENLYQTAIKIIKKFLV